MSNTHSDFSEVTGILISENNKPFYTSQSIVKSRKLFSKTNNSCGCNNCKCGKTQGCGVISLKDTLELLSRINYKITTLSEKVYNNLVYKFPLDKEKDSLRRLLLYRESILRYKNKLLRSHNLDKVSKHCVKNKNIQLIFEKAKHLLGVGYSPERSLHYKITDNIPQLEDGLIIDSSRFNSWLSSNPYCAPIDFWEKLSYHICGKLNIDIVVEEVKCNLTFEIIKETIPLEVLSGLSIGGLTKKNKIFNKRSPDECKLDWEILVEDQSCDIDYDIYIKLITDCNLSYDLVAEAYKCGLSFTLEDRKCSLEGKNFSYKIEDIQFGTPITSIDTLSVDGIKISNNHTLDNASLEKLLSDYKLSAKELKKLK